MNTFTLRHDGRKRRMALVSLYPSQPSIRCDNSSYHVSCGAYAHDARSGRMEYQGVSVRGEIPVCEMVRWAIRKGFLTWEQERSWGGLSHGT